jgi:hypothetical protein
MSSTSQNQGQKGNNSQGTPPSIRRGAVSVQTLAEYKKLQPHKNDKDKLLQYKDCTKAHKAQKK